MYKAKATKKLSSAIVVASSRFALFSLLFLGASFSAAPAASAVDHVAAALTPTERQGRECGCVFRGHSNCHRRRRPSCSRVIISARNVSQRPSLPKTFLQSTVQLLICEWMSDEAAKKIEAQKGTSTQQEAQLDGSNTCGTAPTSTTTHSGSAHPQKQNKKQKKIKTRRQGVAVCVALRVSARPGRKNKAKQEGKKCVLPPQTLAARPHVTAPSARRSSRPLLMRAAGEAHRAVVTSVSVGVRVEWLGGNTRHPSQEECSNKQLKREE
ncbi:hypothetical protein TCDM_12372 [Trypanosoma cruzi Dm28c]|uniref:Uncharacterized protein n=1 Tax=Trypanosoma cruzi Dm28c TaxID=1416333 RepID=V5AYE5_TRYCR|nr:hypothetical protein TCDM_12372 [Trypanosoma cruzi Dm28c]